MEPLHLQRFDQIIPWMKNRTYACVDFTIKCVYDRTYFFKNIILNYIICG